MKLYYNLTAQCRVDEDNCRLTGLPVVYYGTTPIWELQLYQGAIGTEPDVPDVSGLTAWRAAIDTDWTSGTDPVCRTVEGIDFSRAAAGLLTIPLNANTVSFSAKLNGKKSLNGFFELRGFNSQGSVENIILFGVTLHNAIDPDGGVSPESITPDTITRAEVMACLRAPDERQFTSDPSDSSAAHSSQTASDLYTRRRNSAAAGEWGPWEALIQGPEGDMPSISAGSAASIPAGSVPTVEVVSSGGGYTMNFGIPAGAGAEAYTSQVSSGAVIYTSDSAHGSASAVVSNGISPSVSVTQVTSGAVVYTSDSAHGSASAVISNGISPSVSVTSLSSGAKIITSDAAHGTTSVTILNGSNGSNGSVTSITQYDSSTLYWEMEMITYNGGGYQVISRTSIGENPDNTPEKFVCFASARADVQKINSTGSAIDFIGHEAHKFTVTSGAVISVDSSGLASNVCVTAELWLDMPSPAVSFTLPAFTWVDGAVPDFDSANTRYVIVVRWNGTKFLACSAYEESLA